MAATKPSLPTEAGAAPPGVSYAQAAKNKSQSLHPTSHPMSHSQEGTDTQKDMALEKLGKSWADESEDSQELAKKDTPHGTVTDEDSTVTKGGPQISRTPTESQVTAVSAISTPEFGISSTSTLAEKEDASSIPNTSSESTWENKSQASNSADKSKDSSLKDASVKSEDIKENSPLKEAPPPPVNIWQQRAKEQQAAKAALQQSPAKIVSSANKTAEPSKKTYSPISRDGPKPEARRKARSASAGRETGNTTQGKARKRSADAGGKSRDEGKGVQNRRMSRFDNETERSFARKTGSKTILPEREDPKGSTDLPSVSDETSWPAMGANTHEEKQRKPQEKEEKERTTVTSSKSHGKQEWVQIQIPPANYLFDTPLPNTNPRRGGRGNRGGRDNSSRGASNSINGPTKGDRSTVGGNSVQSTETSNSGGKRNRSVGDQPLSGDQNASPRTAVSKGSIDLQSSNSPLGESTTQRNPQGYGESKSSGGQAMKESQSTNNHSSRQPGAPKWKHNQRNVDLENERRRESEPDAKRESRRSSNATQTEETRERRSTITGDFVQASRYDRYDRREDLPTRSSWKESGHETYPSRGNGRGRGRGSRRGGFSHGFHPGNHNGLASIHGSSYTFPTSPTYQQPFGSSSQSQRGYRGPRSQSVANGEFARGTGSYASGPGQMPPLQTWVDPAAYEYQMMQSMSAMPWHPQMDPFALVGRVIQQLEYYLSLENMLKDTFLRSHMDSKGYLDLDVVANFPRLKGYEMEMIKLGCYESSEIDFKVDVDGKYKIRKNDGWQQWVLDMEQRRPSAQTEGSDQLQTPSKPQPSQFYFEPFQYGSQPPMSPGHMPNGYNGYAMNSPYPATSRMSMPSYPFSAPPDFVHPNEGFPERHQQSELAHPTPDSETQRHEEALGVSSIAPGQQEPDSFPDDKIPGLNVVYRMRDANNGAPSHSQESWTFSNGPTEDGRTLSETKESTEQGASQANGGAAYDGENGLSPGYRTSSPLLQSLEHTAGSQHVEVLWVKDSSTPVDRFPPDVETEPYGLLHLNALNDRFAKNAEPCSKNMLVLYQFWSHFLIRNFSTIMYNEFRKFAFEDAARGSITGVTHLIEFYGKSLSNQSTIRERVARHYAGLVKREGSDSSRAAFQQLRKQWRDGALNMKNRKRISEYIDTELKAELES